MEDNFIRYKCLSCNKNYSNKINEELNKRFKDTFKFANSDMNKFTLLLRKSASPYEYMDDWEKFDFIKKKNLLAIWIWKMLQMQITCMQKKLWGLWNKKFTWISWFVSTRWYITFGWCFQKLQKYLFKNLSFTPCKISFSSWISMTSSFKKDLSKTRIINWYWYAFNGWKRN